MEKIEKIKKLVIEGLKEDGADHKQWVLEQVLVMLGYDLAKVKKEEQKKGYDWDDGVPI